MCASPPNCSQVSLPSVSGGVPVPAGVALGVALKCAPVGQAASPRDLSPGLIYIAVMTVESDR